MNLELDENEKAALVELLRVTIEGDRFPLSPRIRRLRGILARLGVTKPPRQAGYPAPKPPGEPSLALAKKRRR